MGNGACPGHYSISKLGRRGGGLNVLERLLRGHLSLVRGCFIQPDFRRGSCLTVRRRLSAARINSAAVDRTPRVGPLALSDGISSRVFRKLTGMLGSARIFAADIAMRRMRTVLTLGLSSPLGTSMGHGIIAFFSTLHDRGLVTGG